MLKIKPSERADEDVLAWAFEKHGAYSVGKSLFLDPELSRSSDFQP